ncbi:MAG: hypothetical protein Q4E67_00165 [Planctomycetia bacterium]|nr:hypothetical protein [Planctomycetia bacterium]
MRGFLRRLRKSNGEPQCSRCAGDNVEKHYALRYGWDGRGKSCEMEEISEEEFT